MSIFKAFQKDRKIGTTPFSLNYQNALTANFGGLTPIGSIPVIPKDKFKCGTNILTKVEPMPAPAFTRMKQNQYSFFVPNAQIWKHWNDYVSNGTAYADTYGNNSNNQQTDNLWRPPQISVNQLQLISKLANGWAIPVFCYSDFLFHLFSVLLPHLTDEEVDFINLNFHWNNCNPIVMVLFVKAKQFNLLPEWFFTDIPYWECALNPDYPPLPDGIDARTRFILMFSNISVEFGCDLYTAYRLNLLFLNLRNLRDIFNQKITNYVDNLNDTQTYLSDSENTQRFDTKIVAVRCFSDNVSNDVSDKHSPFVLEKMSACDTASNNRPFTYYVYRKNIYTDTVVDSSSVYYENARYVTQNRRVRNCGYFWSTDVLSPITNNISQYHPFYLNNYVFNVKNPNPDSDLASFLGMSLETMLSEDLFLTMHNFKNSENEILYDTTLSNISSEIPSLGSWAAVGNSSDRASRVNISHNITPFTLYTSESLSNTDGVISLVSGVRKLTNYFDAEIPVFFESTINQISNLNSTWTYAYAPPRTILFTFESYNIGFDSWSFLIYLCKNSCKLIDYFNIPLEGFTSRSFDFYVGEYVKALPFMAYSKIWNDYFRNKVTSSAELDYKEVNSVTNIDFAQYVFIKSCYENGVSRESFPKWIADKLDSEETFFNGWSLPFSCAPKNAMEAVELDLTEFSDVDQNPAKIKISDFNHFHDLRCISWWHVLSVLTGWQLQDITMSEIMRYYNVFDHKLYGILADKLYLPSYYNGLLHYKYQNFNKDYFSSALLDPMSGANQEQIGDTVNSLVNAEARQGFWNRLAQNRSVTQFWQSVFGVTPSHNDYDKPLMLGSAHTDVNVGEVVQLSQTDNTPQGQRSGLGSAHDSAGLFKHTFNEHGYIIILVSHTLELQYMQGLERDWTPEESFLDLPFIDFVGLGNQSISQKELNFTTKPKLYPSTTSGSKFSDGTSFGYAQSVGYDLLNKINNSYPSTPKLLANRNFANQSSQTIQANLANGSGTRLNDIFGYIPRYSTFKFKFDQVHGEFRNQLMFWHSFRKFFTQPILCHEFVNWEFMSENDELLRMFFVMDETTDKFKIDAFVNITAIRPLPYVCTPKTSI